MAEVTIKGSPIHTNGNLPKVGAIAPDFKLVDNDLKEHSLGEFKGKKKLLSIVPSLDTSVCSTSAKKFNESAGQKKNSVILVISADSPFAQKRICGAENLSNILTLSLVRSKKFAEDYGVLLIDGPLAGLCARAIVVLDENDKVLYTELVPEIAQEPNYEMALKAL
ncbi:MAG: thiol peroxidase [Verrucomicrobia bacterium]|nr:thiol peroxidase [Verrucomicrobiota bacterium]